MQVLSIENVMELSAVPKQYVVSFTTVVKQTVRYSLFVRGVRGYSVSPMLAQVTHNSENAVIVTQGLLLVQEDYPT